MFVNKENIAGYVFNEKCVCVTCFGEADIDIPEILKIDNLILDNIENPNQMAMCFCDYCREEIK